MVNFASLSKATRRPRGLTSQVAHIEDVLALITLKRFYTDIADVLQPGSWSDKFLISVNEWANDNDRALTTAQASKLLRIIRQCRDPLVAIQAIDADTLDQLILRPQYRQPLVETIAMPRQARCDGDYLILRGKFPPELSAALKRLNVRRDDIAQWDWINRLWTVRVDPAQVSKVIAIIGQYQFEHDDAVVALLARASERASEPPVFWLDGNYLRIEAGQCSDVLHCVADQQASSGAARRMIQIAGLFDSAIIDDAVVALAERDRVDVSSYPQPAIRQFVKDVVDLDFRAVVPLPPHWHARDCTYWVDPLIAALQHASIDHVVLSHTASLKAVAAVSGRMTAVGLTVDRMETYDFLKDEKTPPRSALLLHMGSSELSPLSWIKDHYPRTIIITDTVSGSKENLAGRMPTQQEAIADRHLLGRFRERSMRDLNMLFRVSDALSRYPSAPAGFH